MKMPGFKKEHLKNPMVILLLIMPFILIVLVVINVSKTIMHRNYLVNKSLAPIVVSTTEVRYEDWRPQIHSLGSLRAVHGVIVTTEVDGIISDIFLSSNQEVKTGDPLVQLIADNEIAALQALQASAKLAGIKYERDKVQGAFNGVSQEVLDNDQYALESLNAQVAQQTAIVAKKTIRAPFDGKLGISMLNKGQFLAAGSPIISLQAIDSLYVDFYTPEQNLSHVSVDQTIHLYADAFPKRTFTGKITAIDPLVEVETRNIKVEATIPNRNKELLPGMYARVDVVVGKPQAILTIPQTAVSYNPYGNMVYIVQQGENNDSNNKNEIHDKNLNQKSPTEKNVIKNIKEKDLYVKQRFVTLGETRGDQVQVLEGLEKGDQIVTAGQLKLKNNAPITINNNIVPSNDAHPNVGIAPRN